MKSTASWPESAISEPSVRPSIQRFASEGTLARTIRSQFGGAAAHCVADLRAGLGGAEPRDLDVRAALVGPVGQLGVEHAAAAVVLVAVEGEVEAVGAGAVQQLQEAGQVGRAAEPRAFEVGDVERQAGALADLDRLADRVQEGVALAAQVGDVDAAVLRDDLAHGDHLVGVGPHVGRVGQGGREAEGAVFHPLADEAAHPVQLGRGGGAHLPAHRADADGVVRDEVADVDGGGPLEAVEVRADAGPVPAGPGDRRRSRPARWRRICSRISGVTGA